MATAATRPFLRSAAAAAAAARTCRSFPRAFSASTTLLRPAAPASSPSPSPSPAPGATHNAPPRTTHFGFEDGVTEADKTERVAGVFHSVADSYDRMNDLMSFGWHRIWKCVLCLLLLVLDKTAIIRQSHLANDCSTGTTSSPPSTPAPRRPPHPPPSASSTLPAAPATLPSACSTRRTS